METLLLDLVTKYPAVMSLLVAMSVFRLVFKPLFAFLHVIVDATPTTTDNKALEEVESSAVYKSIAWLADYLLSVKLPV